MFFYMFTVNRFRYTFYNIKDSKKFRRIILKFNSKE